MKTPTQETLFYRISKNLGITAICMGLLMIVSVPSTEAALTDKGILHPTNRFPTWFSDANGVTLQLCLDGDGITGLCTFDPVISSNPTSVATGFGAEAFWWSAGATINMNGGGKAILVLALEAAYGQGNPAPNDQFAFGRVRIRVDIPVDGEYKIWHPALNETNGCQPETYIATAGIKAINVTRDTGGGAPFETMLTGEVGPFLTWDPAVAPLPPAGYVGDPTVDHEVVGGHCGINYFRIEAPIGVNLDGSGNNFVQTQLFSVQGKIYDESSTPPGIEPVRSTYFRTTNASTGKTTARINSWVKAPVHATVTLNDVPQANQNGPMALDSENTFFRRATLNATFGPSVPAQLTVVATNSNGQSTTQNISVVDQISIQSAVWTPASHTLKVIALSSDKIGVSTGQSPELTLRVGANTYPMLQSGAAGRFELTLSNINVPPARVTVTSSKGGIDTEEVAD